MKARGNIARYFNHSCDPNCIAVPTTYKCIYSLYIFAIRDIDYREELTLDYRYVPFLINLVYH